MLRCCHTGLLDHFMLMYRVEDEQAAVSPTIEGQHAAGSTVHCGNVIFIQQASHDPKFGVLKGG